MRELRATLPNGWRVYVIADGMGERLTLAHAAHGACTFEADYEVQSRLVHACLATPASAAAVDLADD